MLERISIDNIEMGNLLWGHSRGEYKLPRDEWEEYFYEKFLKPSGFDSYGHFEDVKSEHIREMHDTYAFENDTFFLMPYYWGDDEAAIALPNFIYKPETIVISWYKYPFRDAFVNKDLNFEKFKVICDECRKSVRGE